MERLRIRKALSRSTAIKKIKLLGEFYTLHMVDNVVYITHLSDFTQIYLMCGADMWLALTGFEEV